MPLPPQDPAPQLRRRLCSQRPLPPHSLHTLRCRPCSQTALTTARRCCCRHTPCRWCAAARARRSCCRRIPCRCCTATCARRCLCRRIPCTGCIAARARRCCSRRALLALGAQPPVLVAAAFLAPAGRQTTRARHATSSEPNVVPSKENAECRSHKVLSGMKKKENTRRPHGFL